MSHAELLSELAAICGSEHVLTDPELTASYTIDWSRRFGGDALAVVRPGTADETAAAVAACTRHRVPVIPQGGNTGLVAGGVPLPGGPLPVIISTRRLTSVGPVDQISGQVTVGAGVLLADLHRIAHEAGWEYGVDLAARQSCTIGGNVATNAGGIHVIARGMTRAQVVGIQAAIAAEEPTLIEHLAGLAKDNTGYDLHGLLVGSEGTLGVITAVRVKLHRPAGRTSIALIGCASWDEALDLLRDAVAPGIRVLAAEITARSGIELASALSGLPWPLAGMHEFTLLIEVVDGGDASGFREEILEDRDVVIGLDATTQANLWSYRELQSEAYSALSSREGLPAAHKLDVSIPLESLGKAAAELQERMTAYPGVIAYGVFGHLGDGNIHVEVCGPPIDDEEVDAAVLTIVSKYGGAVSAEHGIGRAKAHYLSLSRSPAEIAVMRAIKSGWDPHGVMNPGVFFS